MLAGILLKKGLGVSRLENSWDKPKFWAKGRERVREGADRLWPERFGPKRDSASRFRKTKTENESAVNLRKIGDDSVGHDSSRLKKDSAENPSGNHLVRNLGAV